MRFIFNSIRIWATRLVIGMGISCGLVYAAEPELEVLAVFTGDNGTSPGALVQKPNGNLYGTTKSGGQYDMGTIFVIEPNNEMQTLVTFNGSNGAQPCPRLIWGPDGYLYGTTKNGGTNGVGTVYRLSPDNKLETLASFNQTDGSGPQSDLVVERDGSIYGCTEKGGAYDQGTIFVIDRNRQLKTLFSFSDGMGRFPQGLNRGPKGQFYGATREGGDSNCGTIFTISPRGDLKRIYSFTAAEEDEDHSHLTESSEGSFYGTSYNGGQNNLGTIYSISPEGVLTWVLSFKEGMGAHPGPDLVEWNNGYFYMDDLIQNMQDKPNQTQWVGSDFCGTTATGGEFGNGTIFRTTKDGRLKTLISFTGLKGNHPGASPNSLMAGADGNLYGTTGAGGPSDKGTIFRFRLPN
jgi:uncharacterized repeat protein (TIGR03803 family)